MQNLLPDARYTINFIGKDKDKLVDMLSIIGSDKTARFHNGRWSVLGGTLSSIILFEDLYSTLSSLATIFAVVPPHTIFFPPLDIIFFTISLPANFSS